MCEAQQSPASPTLQPDCPWVRAEGWGAPLWGPALEGHPPWPQIHCRKEGWQDCQNRHSCLRDTVQAIYPSALFCHSTHSSRLPPALRFWGSEAQNHLGYNLHSCDSLALTRNQPVLTSKPDIHWSVKYPVV